MKRIFLLSCACVLLISNTAEARRNRFRSGITYTPVAYTQPVSVAPAANSALPAAAVEATPASYSSLPANAAPVAPVSYSTSTAQGVANLMARSNSVGHWGGNPGYEGCGCGATAAAAYSICCYGNSGMATVDVGYARSASGMWYCCRRYR